MGALASPALASQQLTDFNPTFRSLAVNKKGEALINYTTADGKVRHVLAWGAINANAPVDPAVPQVRFKMDYASGWGKYRNSKYWRTFKNACAPYDGPALSVSRCRVQGAGRHLLGVAVVAALTAAARVRSVAARADAVRAPRLALER